MSIKLTLLLNAITIFLTQLGDVKPFTFDPGKSGIEMPSMHIFRDEGEKTKESLNKTLINQNQYSFNEAFAVLPHEKCSVSNATGTGVQKNPRNGILDSTEVHFDVEKKRINSDKDIENKDYDWFKWIARLRLYKKKILSRKNAKPAIKINTDQNNKYPYTVNSKEEEEGFQLSLWVNSQVYQLNIIPNNSKFTTPDPKTTQKISIFLKELDGIDEILPSAMTLSEIQDIKTKAKSKSMYENERERKKNQDEAWKAQYEKLCQYKSTNGHTRVPQHYAEDSSFGRWVVRQRLIYGPVVKHSINQRRENQNPSEIILLFNANDTRKYKFKNMKTAKKRIMKLLKIGFDFHPQSKHPKGKETWLARFHDLIQFYQENGHCMVPYKYPKNQSLAYWVNNQRRAYKNAKLGVNPELTYAKWKTLDRMNFRWGSEHSDKSWNDRFEELKEYHKLCGDCNVPFRYPSNPSLGLWVSYQRTEYNQIKSKQKLPHGAKYFLTPAKIKALDEINFQWDENSTKLISSPRMKAMKKLEEMREFYLLHDHSNVPEIYPPNQALSDWTQEIRAQYQQYVQFPDNRDMKGKNDCILTNKMVDALNALNFEW